MWWVIKLGWRIATRVRAALGPGAPGDHPAFEQPRIEPIGNLNDLLEGVPGCAAHDELARFDELVKKTRG